MHGYNNDFILGICKWYVCFYHSNDDFIINVGMVTTKMRRT